MHTHHPVEKVIQFYEDLSREGLQEFKNFYAEKAYFKDPFNEVTSVEDIIQIFSHLFEKMSYLRFEHVDMMTKGKEAMIQWRFHFCLRKDKEKKVFNIEGISVLHFNEQDEIVYHRDFWDAGEEIYEKIPGIGIMLRFLKKQIS